MLATLVGVRLSAFVCWKSKHYRRSEIQPIICGIAEANTTYLFKVTSLSLYFLRQRQFRAFGAMYEGMTGDPKHLSLNLSGFFTAIIFACSGIAVSAICAPMLIIQLTLRRLRATLYSSTDHAGKAMMATLAPWADCCWWRPACVYAWNQNVSGK